MGASDLQTKGWGRAAMTSPFANVAVWAVHGMVATVAMSAWMATLQRAGLLGKAPPRKISERLMVGVFRSWPGRSERQALSAVNHLAFGAVAGAVFRGPTSGITDRSQRVAVGMAYGAAIWASMYGYVLPALRLMPRASQDRGGRPLTMATAHLVFGAVLGVLSSRRCVRGHA